jgi:hypothetical protein
VDRASARGPGPSPAATRRTGGLGRARALSLALVAAGVALPIALETRDACAGEPRRVELRWIAEASCPSGDAVVSAVEQLVQGSPPKDVIVARAEVTHDDAWRVRLETRSGHRVGKRSVTAETCEQLADATALILALMIDPTASRRKPEPIAVAPPVVPPPPPPPVVAPPPPPVAPPAPAPRAAAPPLPEPRRRWPSTALAVVVTAVGDVGTLPGPAIGVGGSLGLSLGAYRFTTELGYFPTRSGHLADRPAAGGDFTLVTGATVACRSVLTLGRASAGVCLGAELDAVLAKGFGVSQPQSGTARWGALLAGGRVDVKVAGPVSAELRVAGVVPFARPPFYFDDIGTVYRPTAVALRLGLGLRADF